MQIKWHHWHIDPPMQNKFIRAYWLHGLTNSNRTKCNIEQSLKLESKQILVKFFCMLSRLFLIKYAIFAQQKSSSFSVSLLLYVVGSCSDVIPLELKYPDARGKDGMQNSLSLLNMQPLITTSFWQDKHLSAGHVI